MLGEKMHERQLKYRRPIGVFVSMIFIVLFGYVLIDTLGEKCSYPSECRLLQFVAIASIMGGIVLIEVFVARKKAQGEWKVRVRDIHSYDPSLSSSQRTSISVAKRVGIGLLLSLPAIVAGLYLTAFSGFMVGVFLDSLVRCAMNWIAPIE